MKYLSLYFSLIFYLNIYAQKATTLNFQPKFKAEKFEINRLYLQSKDSLKFSAFKCYITDLQYYNNDSMVFSSSKKAYLLDVQNNNSLSISDSVISNFNIIKFKIGVDSTTNVSGIFEGDLDPVNGMYWTWQSGYINFKIEGTATNCPARNNKFYWHIGGYLPPFYALREVLLYTKSMDNINIAIQIDALFDEIDISKTHQVMSPNHQSMLIADVLPKMFKITQ